jgi:hypothetical protein
MRSYRSSIYSSVAVFAAIAVILLISVALVHASHIHQHHSGESPDCKRECPLCSLLHFIVFDLSYIFEVRATYDLCSFLELQSFSLESQADPLPIRARAPPRMSA